jgi:hypothetical protein
LPGFVKLGKHIRHGVALGVKPTPATGRVKPLLTVQAFGVFAHEQIVTPLGIAQCVGIEGAGDVGFAAATEFTFSAGTTPRAGNF